ncbi:phosphatase PAP2 family protein [Neorhizobium alkalisoli]|uniref:phosphatase PAP2 family protein n=1 Tax=Neorhizobium alkalisoli TaxID=528178 RepID=UPI000CFA3BF3|nr:phosphatase PAP2 family protein [Neorhizobium alkalisoli]
MSGNLRRARYTLLGIAATSYVAVFPLLWIAGLRVDYGVLLPPLLWFGGATVLCTAYCSWRNMQALRSAVEPLSIGLLLVVPTVISTYLAIGAGLPLADASLAMADAAIGFDWVAFVAFVDSRPWLANSLGLAYQSFVVQLLALPVLLSILGRAERAYLMVAGYALICFLASAISIWFPAIGAYPYYRVDADALQNINIHFGYFFLDQFNGVRDNPDFVFSIANAAGILTFPSVHAATAALCAWAAWEIRLLRYPLLVLNIGMAAAAVSHGSHYLVDIPAGIAVACLCIAAVRVATGAANAFLHPRVALSA